MELFDSDLYLLYFALEGCIDNLLHVGAGFSSDELTLRSHIELFDRLHSYLFHRD